MNDLIWQEAFLFDFAQKKTINKWVQKFLVISSYLFNERLVFDYIIRFTIDLFLWPLNKISILTLTNSSNLITWLCAFFFFLFISLLLIYVGAFLF